MVPAYREPESDCNPAVRWRSGQLVTLLELLEINAEAFWRMSGVIAQFMIRLEAPNIGQKAFEIGVSTLGELNRELPKLGLPAALKQMKRIEDALIGSDPRPLQEIRPMLADLLQRACDELDGRFFLRVDEEAVPLYWQKDPLFGPEVEKAFPQMSEDISEAGKCLALGRPTAAIFHLMRLMEIAVQRFGDKLGIALATEKNWQNILDEINKAIKALDQKASQTKAFAGASAHLYNVKVKWRNEVMHPKQTYTLQEARDVFDAVRTFIRDLAGILA